MIKKSILYFILFCSNCSSLAQTFKVVHGDTSYYVSGPCPHATGDNNYKMCLYLKYELKDGKYFIYDSKDTSRLTEAFTIENRKPIGFERCYHENGKQASVSKYRKGRIVLDSTFNINGKFIGLRRKRLGNPDNPLYAYSKNYYENGKMQSSSVTRLFSIKEKYYNEDGKLENYTIYRILSKRTNCRTGCSD